MKEDRPKKKSSENSIVKSIAIGVITPVLAATIIYFLGFNKGGNNGYNRKKEATIKAWTAYDQNKGIFSAVMKQLGGSADIETMRNNINHEIDITVSNLENIKKEPDADQRVYSSVEITAQQIKEMKPIMNKYLDDILAYAATDPTEEEGMAFVLNLGENLKDQMVQLKKRDSLRLRTFYLGLNKDYKTSLPMGVDLQDMK